MNKKEFSSFEDAKNLAKASAVHFGVNVGISIFGEKYVVCIPDSVQILDMQQFVRSVYLFGGPPNGLLLSLLSYIDRSGFSATNLAWCDTATGLTWDVARLIYGVDDSDHPRNRSDVLDELRYAGLKSWRLPTLAELRTLNIQKLDEAGINYSKNRKGQINFWSSEDSTYSGPEKAYLDFASMKTGHQRFIERDKNRSTSGDGYTESAQTIMVTSDLC